MRASTGVWINSSFVSFNAQKKPTARQIFSQIMYHLMTCNICSRFLPDKGDIGTY